MQLEKLESSYVKEIFLDIQDVPRLVLPRIGNILNLLFTKFCMCTMFFVMQDCVKGLFFSVKQLL